MNRLDELNRNSRQENIAFTLLIIVIACGAVCAAAKFFALCSAL